MTQGDLNKIADRTARTVLWAVGFGLIATAAYSFVAWDIPPPLSEWSPSGRYMLMSTMAIGAIISFMPRLP